MKEKYLYILLLFIFTNLSGFAQSNKSNGGQDVSKVENVLEKTQIYPNPVTNGKFYINTENANIKTVELYDMLGKKILVTEISGYQKEFNVQNLKAGVYLLKINDKENSITRKIIIK